jgi:hypothetical protein
LSAVPGVNSPEVKRPGREADHSPPLSVEVKNDWKYTSTYPMCLVGVQLNEAMDTFDGVVLS